MGATISAKLRDEDNELLAWMDTQPESRSALILAALYALRDRRSRGDSGEAPIVPTSPIDMAQLVAALVEALKLASPDIGRAIGKQVASQLAVSGPAIYTNEVEAEPIKDDHLLDEMLQGLEDWMA